MSVQSIHQFAEKVALVTDGANPIGRAVALQLALQGSFVIVGFSDSNAATENALTELQSLGTLANAVEADVSTVAGAEKLVGEVEKIFGRIDLLINCHKYESAADFQNVTGEIYDKSFDANVKAAFFVTQNAVKLMAARPKPKIVNVVSALDTPETRGNILDAAANNAMIGLTKSLAVKLPAKFRVNAVAVSEKTITDPTLDAELFQPKKGFSADDAARTILFLLSSEAVGLNGQILTVE